MDALGRIKTHLKDLGDITARPLFGGHRIDWNDVIVGILSRGRLHFKVDEESKDEYAVRGMEPFRPNERQTLKSYDEVPPETLDDQEPLLSWAQEATRVGQESMRPAP